jgi:hypothetical protein
MIGLSEKKEVGPDRADPIEACRPLYAVKRVMHLYVHAVFNHCFVDASSAFQ